MAIRIGERARTHHWRGAAQRVPAPAWRPHRWKPSKPPAPGEELTHGTDRWPSSAAGHLSWPSRMSSGKSLLVDSRIARGRCFALKVKGDSMIDADINDGDYVIVRQQPLAELGEIVVAMLENDATVKRLRMAGEGNCSWPENRRRSIQISGLMTICG